MIIRAFLIMVAFNTGLFAGWHPWGLNPSDIIGFGINGGLAHRIKAQSTPSKKGCCFISVAPRLYTSLFWGSFTNKPHIKSLAAELITGDSNRTGWSTMLNSVSRVPDPLKGVLPNNNSYKKIPKAHQSTAPPWPAPYIISGARYSWVPTNDIERAPVGSARRSGSQVTRFPISFFGFCSWLDLWKLRGKKHDVWIQEGLTEAGWTR